MFKRHRATHYPSSQLACPLDECTFTFIPSRIYRFNDHLRDKHKLNGNARSSIIPKPAGLSDPRIWACRFCILYGYNSCDTYEAAEQHDWKHLKEGKTKQHVNSYYHIHNLLSHPSVRHTWEISRAGYFLELRDRNNDELLTLIENLEFNGPGRRHGYELAKQAADLLLPWPESISFKPGFSSNMASLHHSDPAGSPMECSEIVPKQTN